MDWGVSGQVWDGMEVEDGVGGDGIAALMANQI